MHDHLLPRALDPEYRQNGDRADLSADPHLEVEAVEVEVDEIEVGERPLLPRLDHRLEPLHHPTNRALAQRPISEQRLQGPADPPCVGSAQVDLEQGGVHLSHPPGIAGQDGALPFRCLAIWLVQARPGHGQRRGAGRSRELARLHAVPIPDAGARPPIPRAHGRRQFFLHHPPNCGPNRNPHRGLDHRLPLRLARTSRLWHRRHRRISSRCAPPRASRLVAPTPPRRYAISLFHNYRDTALTLPEDVQAGDPITYSARTSPLTFCS